MIFVWATFVRAVCALAALVFWCTGSLANRAIANSELCCIPKTYLPWQTIFVSSRAPRALSPRQLWLWMEEFPTHVVCPRSGARRAALSVSQVLSLTAAHLAR